MIGLGGVDVTLPLPLILPIKARMPKRTISASLAATECGSLPFSLLFNIPAVKPPIYACQPTSPLDCTLSCRRLILSLTVSLRDSPLVYHVILRLVSLLIATHLRT